MGSYLIKWSWCPMFDKKKRLVSGQENIGHENGHFFQFPWKAPTLNACQGRVASCTKCGSQQLKFHNHAFFAVREIGLKCTIYNLHKLQNMRQKEKRKKVPYLSQWAWFVRHSLSEFTVHCKKGKNLTRKTRNAILALKVSPLFGVQRRIGPSILVLGLFLSLWLFSSFSCLFCSLKLDTSTA